MPTRLPKLVLNFFSFLAFNSMMAQSIDITGPAGSERFGSVTVLPNGNYVVIDPYYDEGATVDVGAVYLYNGSTHVLISTLKGSSANDRIGSNFQPTVLSNSNFIIQSWGWDNGAAANVGAITWINGTTGLSGVVNSSNSLIGSQAADLSGSEIDALPNNGNYIVRSYYWSNGAVTGAGAVTWCNGTTGKSGTVGSSISLVGTLFAEHLGASLAVLTNGNYVIGDPGWNNGFGAAVWCNGTTGRVGTISSGIALVGSNANHSVGNNIKALSNGNYVVVSWNWDNGAISQVGAVTWCNGTTGRTGLVSAANSLIGSRADDQIGSNGIIALNNGNYVVVSPYRDNSTVADVGAVTWGNGTAGTTGVVSNLNSIVGSSANDLVGYNGVGLPAVTVLSNNNYVVLSPYWDNGVLADAGAVTWGNGATGTSGIITNSNSLVGSAATDKIGNGGVFALPNGNYVISSWSWDNGAVTDAGAATWGNGTTGITGAISGSNSLVGGSINDQVGYNYNAITVLPGSNYVVKSIYLDNGAMTDAGAVTWGNGTTGTSGIVASSNSLIGSNINDNIGSGGIVSLLNGNYVVSSPNWDNGTTNNAGAVTWCNGTVTTSDIVSAANSFIGSTADDNVGSGGVSGLFNSNYVIKSPNWDNGALVNAGAVTWCDGLTTSGVISSSNSLAGTTTNDNLGSGGVTALYSGNYVVRTPNWDNGVTVNSGAVTFGNGATGLSGTVNTCNSVLGNISNGGSQINFAYNYTYDYLVVGRRSDNIVSIFDPTGMLLADNLDAQTVTISGNNTVPLLSSTGCRIIATLTATGASPVSGSVTAKAWVESSVPNYAGDPFVARHYEITPAVNATSATGRVKLYFTQQEFTDFNNDPLSVLDLPTGPADAIGIANLRIGKFGGISNDGSGLPGTYPGVASVINPDDVDIVWNNGLSRWEVSFDVTGFSGFFVQTKTNVLPITSLELNGQLNNNNAILNWITKGEINTLSFDIERSTDGRTYTAFGNVAALNQSGTNTYTYTDNNINAFGVSVVYYRIKQKDINGRFTYSGIIALSIDKQKSFVLFYPNPVIEKANLSVTINKPQQVVIKIFDNTGRLLQQRSQNLSTGTNALPVDIKNLAEGVYYLAIKGETISEHISFVKQ